MSPRTVRVELNRRGEWEIQLPNEHRRVACETLEDAQRVAYLNAAHHRPCELIVCDAYHRVLRHELIAGEIEPIASEQRIADGHPNGSSLP